MGCGKSSVGRILSELLCCPFVDLDAEIEARCGCTVAEIFEASGEAEFRRLEKETLKDILETEGRGLEISPSSSTPACKNQEHPSNERPQMILALGGGAVMTQACERMVHEETLCIYLKASVDTLISHLEGQAAGRPLLNTAAMPSASVMSSEPPSVMSSEPPSVMSSEVETSPLRKRILELMSLRAETYERTAHHIIDTDGKTIADISSKILDIIS